MVNDRRSSKAFIARSESTVGLGHTSVSCLPNDKPQDFDMGEGDASADPVRYQGRFALSH